MSLLLKDILLLKTWRIYRISPLHNFKQDISTLSSYTKLLLRFLRSEHGQYGKISTEVTPTADPNLLPSVVIAANQERESKETGCLVVISSIGSLQSGLEPNFFDFPVLLAQGVTSPLCSSILSWIQLKFDCCITPLNLSTTEMTNVLYNFINYQEKSIDKLNRAVELVFEVPSTIQGLKHITINFDVDSIKNILNSVQTNNPKLLVDHLYAYYYENFKIDLNKLALVRIGTPLAYLNYDGKFKILSNPLEYLEHIAVSIERNHIGKKLELSDKNKNV